MSYTAIVTREGDEWLGDVPELEGASTYASTLRRLRENLREVVILAAELDDDADPEIVLDFRIQDPAIKFASSVREARAAAEHDLAIAQAETPTAVRRLVARGYSVRDTADIVGITPGRVSQLTKEPADA